MAKVGKVEKDLKVVIDKAIDNAKAGAAISGREQKLIKKNGGAKSEGGTSGNAINGVGPNNKKKGYYENEANKL